MKKINGFTLIELMVAVTVLAVLLTMGIPQFSKMLSNNRMTSTTNSVLAGIQMARAEAITRGVPVIFCQNNATNNGCSGITNLANGWLVGTDTDADGAPDEILKVSGAYPGTMQVTGNANFLTTFIRFNASGLIESGNITPPATFTICDSSRSGETGKNISVNATGGANLNTTNPTCS